NNKKICGILSELLLNKEEEIFVIVGCGINLNNDYFNSEIKEIATSYYLQKNKKINKNLFLARLIEKINLYFDNYLAEKRDQIINQWKETLNLTGKKVDLRHNGKKETVLIKEIMDNGDLLVEFADGRQKKLQSSNTSLNYQSLEKYNDCSQEGEKNEI
ncbi:MAG: BirA family transcriptional regulator, biotin operon repressor / biotin-acetyl-CoA-carboxylase ligase, partial [Halanaerobium sp.]